jgi:hypothetical protein
VTKGLSAVLKWCMSFSGVGAALVGALAFGSGHTFWHHALFIVVLAASTLAFAYAMGSGLYHGILWLLWWKAIRKNRPQPVQTRSSVPNRPIKWRLLSRSSSMDLRDTDNFALGAALFTVVLETAAFLSVLAGIGMLAFYAGIVGVPSLGISILLVVCSMSDTVREAFHERIIGEAAIVLLVIAIDVSTIAIPAMLA